MRMWLVDVKTMCDKHLLGEHNECHILAGCVRLNKKITGFLRNKLVDPQRVVSRHDELVEEMLWRGFNHKSPLILVETDIVGEIDINQNLIDLHARCKKCKEMYNVQV